MSFFRRFIAKTPLGQALGLRSLRLRLSVLPVAVVLAVSLIAAFLIHQKAQTELYESREQLARGLADNLTQHLTDQLSEVRDEMSSWARFLAGPAARSLPGATEQDRFQIWLRGLGDLATSRYDMMVLADRDGKIVAINDMALSVPLARPLGTERLLGQHITALLGKEDEQWIRPTIDNGLPAVLSWRAIPVINELYDRKLYNLKTVTRHQEATPDDVVRGHQLVFAAPVRDASGSVTHALIGVASWAPFQRIVDEAERYLTGVGLSSGYGFVFDNGGDRVIAHKLRDPQAPQGSLLGLSVSKRFNLANGRV